MLIEIELRALIQQVTLPFLCNHLESILMFYRYSKKPYSEEIKFMVKLFDLSGDFNIEETIERVNGIKKIIKANAIYEMIDVLLELMSLEQTDLYKQRIIELKQRLTSGMIPLFKLSTFEPIKTTRSEIYSWGSINFNVSAIQQAVQLDHHQFTLINIETESLFWQVCDPNRINIEVALNCDLKKPLLFIEYKEGTSLCIDGQHRLYKAHYEHVESLPAYIIKAGQFLPYLYDVRSYVNFIQYWNRHLFNC